MKRTPDRAQLGTPRLSPTLLAGVALVHAGVLAVLLGAASTPVSVTPPRPLMVSLIEPEPSVATPKPAPKPKPPERVRPAPKAAPPVLAARLPDPAPQALSVPAPAPPLPERLPEPVLEPTPAPSPVVQPEPIAAVAPPVAAAPQPTPLRTLPPRAADYLTNPKPAYPMLSRRLGEEGVVRLNILVKPDGSVDRAELAESSGHPRLDRAALETVQSRWKFEPARHGDKPVAAWVIVPIQFTLRS